MTLVKVDSERAVLVPRLRRAWVGETLLDRTTDADAGAQAEGGGICGPTAGCVTQQPPSGRQASYLTVRIPPASPDPDCGNIPHRRFQVFPPHPHRLGADADGIACGS
ncbi:MAG: hypothetical protein WD156_09385 [Acidimicrobiia bacterium]